MDLVIDHSVQVDEFGTDLALANNMAMEFERNRERYEFLRWGQQAFDNFGVVPPASGIVHQVNLEYLAKGVQSRPEDDGIVVYPDSLVGTDTHTTMINGLGIVGWGVGGIEAEAVMLGQPIYMLMPEVVGFKVTGTLPEGATATDLALRVTQMLRAGGRGRQVRGVLRRGPEQHDAAGPRHDCQHGPRIRRDDGLFPGGRRGAALPAPHRPPAKTRSNWSRRTTRHRACSAPTKRPIPCSPAPSSSTSARLFPVWPAPSARRTA